MFAQLKQELPELRLIQIGGEWTGPQREQIHRLKLADYLIQKRGLTREELAEHYRSAALVLQPSEAEGFGLPVAEALACGAAVLASDIPSLREVGGPAVTFCPVADVDAWSEAATNLLANSTAGPSLDSRLGQASKFTWSNHANIIANAYMKLAIS